MATTTLALPLRTASANPASRYRDHLAKMSDEDLMEQFQAGTLQAFDLLVERYSDRLMRYLYSFIKDSRRCEDLLQDTFLRLYRNRHAYSRIAKLSTWLYTIAGNLARSEYRRRRRKPEHSIYATNSDRQDYEIEIPDEQFSPERHTEATLQQQYVQEALNKIPMSFRELIVLRDIQQLSYEEIAEISGLPMGTVKSRINRGRIKLRRMLEDVYPFPLPA